MKHDLTKPIRCPTRRAHMVKSETPHRPRRPTQAKNLSGYGRPDARLPGSPPKDGDACQRKATIRGSVRTRVRPATPAGEENRVRLPPVFTSNLCANYRPKLHLLFVSQ